MVVISCSDTVNDCLFTGNQNDSLVFVCNESLKPNTEVNCIGHLFENDNRLIYRAAVKLLSLGDCRGENLNRDFFKTFTNLREFDISFYGTEYLTAETLQMDKLEKLNATHNKITNLTGSILINLKNVVEIDFSFNLLTNLDSSSFDGITKVANMNFSHNKIHTLAVDTFSKLSELKILDLSKNLISKIHQSQFKMNKNLLNLQLEGNPMKRFDGNIFELLLNSVTVVVSWDNLQELDTTCFKQLLTIVVQPDALIFEASDFSFNLRIPKENLKNLVSFNISGNQLSNAQSVIESLISSIKILDVSSNFIGKLSVHTFEKFDNLEYLNLSRTNLSNFGFSTFFHQRKLKALDISYNQLKMVNFTLLLRNYNNLNTLNLEGNDLTEINTLTNARFPKLTTLGISKNRFTCDYLAKFLLHWSQLHLINNPSNEMHIDGVDCVHENHDISEKNDIIHVTNTSAAISEEKDNTTNETGEKNVITNSETDVTPTQVLNELRTVKYLLFVICIMGCGYMAMKTKVVQQIRQNVIGNSLKRKIFFRRDSHINQPVMNLICDN